MKLRTSLPLLAAVLQMIPAPGSAQDPRLESRLSPAARSGVAQVVEQARQEGLPTEPLIQRALEGASRGADATRISATVSEFADRLRTARSALGIDANEVELVAAAGALYAGISQEELRRLRSVQPHSLAAPLVTLADLLERGVPKNTSLSVILSLLDSRVPPEDYGRLRQAVAQDIRRGAAPAAAAQTRAQGLLLERQPPTRRGPVPDRRRGPFGPRQSGGRPLR